MPNNIPAALSEFRAAVQAIHDAYPGLTDDDLADTIEGESGDLEAVILRTLRSALEREATADALKEMGRTMQARMARLAEGAQMMRNAVLHAMTEAGIKKIPAPDMSVSIGAGKQKVQVTDEDLIPLDLCRTKIEPDKTKIGKALEAGQEVPGASLSNSVPVLTIRRS